MSNAAAAVDSNRRAASVGGVAIDEASGVAIAAEAPGAKVAAGEPLGHVDSAAGGPEADPPEP